MSAAKKKLKKAKTPATRKRSGHYAADSERALRFCPEFLKDCNQTKAAERAGYSPRRARQAGYQLMQLPAIQARVQQLMDARAKRVEASADKTLGEIARLAHSDLLGLYDVRGALKPIHEIPEEIRRAIASIETEELYGMEGEGDDAQRVLTGYTRKVKLWNKPEALQLEGRHQKLFTDRLEVTEGLADSLAAARARAKNR